ncbi:MAG: heat-inducible transcription repressor HrcA [Desulfobacteraceae bacterium 4572_35.1]|nr:MAG: heat-inducible transcription repressor HrcA [Desulfobacteraceae bacterium 4572_35.1]
MGLNERSLSILDAIVEGHIASGEPIGSRTIADRQKLRLSPATVRNVMADLEERGYLVSPHTSAGRIPTDKGYRFYVDTLLQVRNLTASERQQIEVQCNSGAAQTQELLKQAGRILSSMSNYTGIVLAPRFAATTFRHIEFVLLSQGRLLVIFVSQSGLVQNKIIQLDGKLPTASELQQITNYLNDELCGLTINEVRAKIVEQMQQEKAQYDAMMKDALGFSQEIFSDDIESDVIIDGAANILEQPDFIDRSSMQRLFRAFEQKNNLINLLDKSQQAQGVQIYIGSQVEFQEFEGCSLITTNYTNGKQPLGSLGVIGPSRMKYSQVVAIVDYTAQLVSRALKIKAE